MTEVFLDEIDPSGPLAPQPIASADEAQGLAITSVSPTRMAMRRFVRHRVALGSLIVLGLIAIACALAPILAPYAVNERDPTALAQPPQAGHWFGTDDIGRDIFSRVLWGGRVSLMVGIFVALSAGLLGTFIGAFSGYRGGRLDNGLMRATDLFLALPLLVILLIMRQLPEKQEWAKVVFGPPGSIRLMVTLLTVVGWMGTARLVRGVVLSLKEKEFVEAARALGAEDRRIIARHIVPNCLGPIIVAMTFTVAAAIALESTLSYFGFGLDPLKASWGNLLSDSKGAVTTGRWWLVLFPALALIITIICINFIGDGLRDAFDPKQQRVRV